MKEDKDWIELMRTSLRDAEVSPPEDGWERLERVLSEPVPAPPVRKPAWRIYMPRIAAAAAVVLIGVVAGDLLLRPDTILEQKGVVIATTEEDGSAAETPERLRRQVQLPVEVRREGASARTGEYAAAVPQSAAVAKGVRTAAAPAVREAVSEWEAPAATTPAPAAERNVLAAADEAAAPAVVSAATASRSETRTVDDAASSLAASSRGTEPRGYLAPKPRRPLSFSLSAGGGVSRDAANTPSRGGMMAVAPPAGMPSMIGNGSEMVLLRQYDYDENRFRHHQPLSFALMLRKEFAHGLSLESGLNYTLLRSDVGVPYASDDVAQRLHFLGIPLRINWQFLERGRFSLYVGAGGMVEKCVSATFGAESLSEPGVQWSLLAAAGAQYRLGGMVGLYFEPEGSYYLTETRLRTARTDSPLTLTLRLGVRLSF